MIFVTGGTGFVGRQVVCKLVEAGREVKLLVRDPKRFSIPHQRITTGAGDITLPETLEQAMAGCKTVIHLVGIIRETGKQTFENIHTRGTENVVAAAQRCGVRKIVHMSALGSRPGARSRYHRSKWEGEEIVRQGGIPYVILRPSIIVGPEDEFVNLFARLLKHFPGILGIVPVVGPGRNRFQPIGVSEVAQCFVRAAIDPSLAGREFSLTGPETLSYNQIIDAVQETVGKRRLKLHIPFFIARTAAFFLERFPNPPLSRDQILMLEEDNIADNTEMKRVFGIEPRPFREVIASYLAARR